MFKFQINNGISEITISLPNHISEINTEYLNNVTSDIVPAEHYSLIALVRKESASKVLFAANQKKDITTFVIPVFIKAGKTDSEFINSIQMGDKIIASSTEIGIGNHVIASKDYTSISNFLATCAEDKSSYTKCLEACKQDIMKGECYFLEFKIIPNNTIHGIYSSIENKNNFVNPFTPTAITSIN